MVSLDTTHPHSECDLLVVRCQQATIGYPLSAYALAKSSIRGEEVTLAFAAYDLIALPAILPTMLGGGDNGDL